MWEDTPAELLCAILYWLPAEDVRACACVCVWWGEVCARASVWRELLKRDFLVSATAYGCLARRTTRRPHAARKEYDRCSSQWRRKNGSSHVGSLTHVSLSGDAILACTSSQDGTFAIWRKKVKEWTVLWKEDVQLLGWWHPVSTRFCPNPSQTEGYKLLISGALRVDASSPKGELAVYVITDNGPRLLSRMSISPLSARGAWWSEGRILTAEMHWLSRQACATTLWLCADTQETQSEFSPIMSQLCRIFNDSGSVPRLLELCSAPIREEGGISMVEIWDDQMVDEEYFKRTASPITSVENNEEIDKLLIYACGMETSASHVLCFTYLPHEAATWPAIDTSQTTLEERVRANRVRRRENREREEETEEERQRREEMEVAAVKATSTYPDRTIDLRGVIVGLALAPDHKMLYAAVHVWRGEHARAIDARVSICAVCTRQLRIIWRASSPSTMPLPLSSADSLLHYLQPAVSRYYVASPQGGCSLEVCIWSRISGAVLRTLRHAAPAHSVALTDCGSTHTLLCASDSHTLTVWESTPKANKDKEIKYKKKTDSVDGHRRTYILE